MCEGQWQGEYLETQMGNTGLNRGNLFLAVGVLGGPFSVCHSPQDSGKCWSVPGGHGNQLRLLGAMFRHGPALEITPPVARARRQVAAPARLLWGRSFGTQQSGGTPSDEMNLAWGIGCVVGPWGY